MQPPFDKLKDKGVLRTRVGYTGGASKSPSYEEVSAGKSGHVEVVEVTFDPKKISYAELLRTFWKNVDLYDPRGQFCDKGPQYLSVVYFANEAQKITYAASLKDLSKAGIDLTKLATRAEMLGSFWLGEDYHQNYYKKNPIRYKFYRSSCGRDSRLNEIWGKSTY